MVVMYVIVVTRNEYSYALSSPSLVFVGVWPPYSHSSQFRARRSREIQRIKLK